MFRVTSPVRPRVVLASVAVTVLFSFLPTASRCAEDNETECLTALQYGRIRDVQRIIGALAREQWSGNPNYLYAMGVCADEGLGQTVDFKRAYELYVKAEAVGSTRARAARILLIYNGQGVSKDESLARKLYEASRDAFEQRVQAEDPFMLYYMSSFRSAFDKDEKGGERLLALSAKKGFVLARIWLLEDVLYDDAKRPQAVKYLKWASANGFWQGDRALLSYLIDEDDPKQAGAGEHFAKCSRNLCIVGNTDPEAAHLVYRCLDEGIGCAANPSVALQWLQVAARRGEGFAQFELGMRLFTGNGITKDHAAAVSWFRRASEQNVSCADLMLACCYSCGLGVAADQSAAAAHYYRAKPFLDDKVEGGGTVLQKPAELAGGRRAAELLVEYEQTEQMGKFGDLCLWIRQSGSANDTWQMGLLLAKRGLVRDALESFDLAEQRRAAEVASGVQDVFRPSQTDIMMSRNLCANLAAQARSQEAASRRNRREARRSVREESRREKFCDIFDPVHGLHGAYRGRRCPACSAPHFSLMESFRVDEKKFRAYRR